MSRPVLALNLSMAGLSVFFSIRLGHALFSPDLQSPSRTARPVAVAPPRNHDVVPNSRSPRVYDVIATRTIFHPNRSISFPQFIREFIGRFAGVGYSALVIASMFAKRVFGSAFCSKRTAWVANPCHVVSPAPTA